MNYNAIFSIIVISVISISFRWIAFNRIDSIAHDISLSSMAYLIIRGKNITFFNFRIIISILIVILLSLVHQYYFQKQTKKIKNIIDQAKNEVQTNIQVQALKASFPLARHAVFLSYVTYIKNLKFFNKEITIRKGKKMARINYAILLSKIYGNSNKFSEHDFCLGKLDQIIGLVLFTFLGLTALLISACDRLVELIYLFLIS